MTTSSYDVVVLGSNLHGLLTAAVLSRRGFRVLVLGQGELPSNYRIGKRELPREHWPFLGTHSPVVRRTMRELALHQLIRRKATALDPAFQVALPGARFELPAAPSLLEAEIAREFPDVRRPVEDVFRTVTHVGERLDALFERELTWPPSTFLERRELARATAHPGFRQRGGDWDPLEELPASHPFRRVVLAPAALATDMDPAQLDGQALCRLFEAWWQGAAHLEGGMAWLREVLVEKIRAQRGEVREDRRVSRIDVRKGRAVGIHTLEDEESIGAEFVVASCAMSTLLDLVPDRTALEQLFERRGEPRTRWFRYTLNVIVREGVMPEGIARDVFMANGSSATPPRHLTVFPAENGEQHLVIQTLLARHDVEERPGFMLTLREQLLDELAALIPFIDTEGHILFVDSPHDGRPALDLVGDVAIKSEAPWNRGPHTMSIVYGYPVRDGLEFCAFPARTPIRRLLLSGPHNVPALGLEGAFLAATSAARAIHHTSPRWRRRRRWNWTKIEL